MTNMQIRDLFNATAFDKDGEKLGAVKEIFVDDHTGQPTFAEVGHGLFGMSSSVVPLRGHSVTDDKLNLAFSKDRIKDAPDLDVNNALTPEDQNRVYEHFGLANVTDTMRYGTAHDDRHRDHHVDPERTVGREPEANRAHETGQHHDLGRDGDSLVRSEERLTVDKDRVQTGEARLRKYVVEDTETVEVPVTREEVRVERTPIDGDARTGGLRNAGIGEDEASVTLHEERVSVNKETVPVEKVSLEKDRVRDTEKVSENVRKEQIEAEGVDREVK